MTTIAQLIEYLEHIAPPQYAEHYDNTGLLVGDAAWPIEGVMVCLDSTEAVVDEAIQKQCNLIVAHHPIIFGGLKRIGRAYYVHRAIVKAIKHDIAIYAIHTNLDNVYRHGVNTRIAEQLALKDTRILRPNAAHSHGEQVIGSGLIGALSNAMEEDAFLTYVKEKMAVSVIRHTEKRGQAIHRVAVCGGSGIFLLDDAIRANADVFITSDVKYHQFFDANRDILLMDIGHYESEQFTVDLLQRLISEKFTNFAARSTEVITNPVYYY